ncbi:MAG: hypothetical protein IBJ15_08645 [Alphaproteobacteria bacterium]|nr:hypothetical protein [Alphaproteobacteria bacterium]
MSRRNADKDKIAGRMPTVLRVPKELHAYSRAISFGLHLLAHDKHALLTALATLPSKARPHPKLLTKPEDREPLDRYSRQTGNKLWVIAAAALTCAKESPAGIQSAALKSGDPPAEIPAVASDGR